MGIVRILTSRRTLAVAAAWTAKCPFPSEMKARGLTPAHCPIRLLHAIVYYPVAVEFSSCEPWWASSPLQKAAVLCTCENDCNEPLKDENETLFHLQRI